MKFLTVCILFLLVSVVAILVFATLLFNPPMLYPENACMGWGTTNGHEFEPPTTAWYNEYCQNITLPITSDMVGHYYEECNCYDQKKSKLLPWERMK